MSEKAYCGNCGGVIRSDANFCNQCGTDQTPFQVEEPPTEAMPAHAQHPPGQTAGVPTSSGPSPAAAAAPSSPPPPPPTHGTATSARENAERVAPGVNDLIEQLGVYLGSPGVALAGLSALLGAGVSLAAALILAIVLPNASYLAVGGGSGLFEQTLAQAVSFSQANLTIVSGDVAFRTVPVLFVLIPILGVATGVATLAPRTAGMPIRERFLWAAAAGVPFAVLMAILCLSVGEVDFDLLSSKVEFSVGSVLLLSLIWGALGGALGMLYAIRQAGEALPNPLPSTPARLAGIGWTALRPLLLALLAVGVIGTAAWVVQMARSDEYTDFPPRSTAVAIGEQLAYVGDHAIAILPLGAGAKERLVGAPALPIDQDDYYELPSDASASEPSSYGIFDFNDTMPAVLFVIALVLLIGIPALLALYAGFAVVRLVGEVRADRAAAWGAVVGPVLSIAMVLLTTLARKDVVGNPSGDSVFIAFLLGGAVLGAIGGLLATQGGTDVAATQDGPGVAATQPHPAQSQAAPPPPPSETPAPPPPPPA